MDADQLHVVEVVALLRQLTAEMINSDDLDTALSSLAATTADAVPSQAWCGITIVRGGSPTTAAASDVVPLIIDEVQHASGEGPCLTAIRDRDIVLCQNLDGEQRWPQWRERALANGVHSVLAVPLDIDDHVIGGLNIYAADADAFPPDVVLTAMLIADHASLLIATVLDRSRQSDLTAQLNDALASGGTVNRAIGIVMAQRGCRAEDALDVLRTASQTLKVPLHEVANRLVDTVSGRSGMVAMEG